MANFSSSSIKWLSLPLGKSVTSLAAAMVTGYAKTTAGRSAWLTLVGQPGYLLGNCNQEGVNSQSPFTSVRLGILGNNENDCISPDSAIGFGVQPDNNVPNLSAGDVTGNNAGANNPGLPFAIPKFGFILGAP